MQLVLNIIEQSVLLSAFIEPDNISADTMHYINNNKKNPTQQGFSMALGSTTWLPKVTHSRLNLNTSNAISCPIDLFIAQTSYNYKLFSSTGSSRARYISVPICF